MVRTALTALTAAALGLSPAAAAELKGTVKKADSTASSLTLTVDGKDQTFKVGKDATFSLVTTIPGKKNTTTEDVKAIDGGLAGVKEGASATVLTDAVDGKDVVTSVKVSGGTAPAKKKKKTK